MSTPVLTFFNNKGGVGKTSLVYHMAWMFSEMGKRVVAIDLDPQANLTSAFLPEEQLEQLWDVEIASGAAKTIYQCVSPLTEVGDLREPEVKQINSRLSRPVKAYDKWAARIPSVYRSSVLGTPAEDIAPESDPLCLARLKHYRSLVPMAQEVRKPIFQLTSADGAIGSHSYAVTEARDHFRLLAKTILGRIGISA